MFKRIITFCVVLASFGFAAAEENRNTFDQLAYQALDAMWGKAIGLDGNLLQPKTEKERTTIPIEPGYVEYVRFPRFFVCQRVGFMLPVFPDAAL